MLVKTNKETNLGGFFMAIEKMLVEHCSATLASIKTANLFNMKFSSQVELEEQFAYWNLCLAEKGIRLFVLRIQNEMALVYVYRQKQLHNDLNRPEVADFLKTYGYLSTNVDYALERLRCRIQSSEVFPHEIGLFLDYPLEDVKGFIENKGQNYKFSGLWKVYCNEDATKKIFQKYKKCKDVYAKLWQQGRSVIQLTVAA